jgi:hypothetical protein
MKKCILLILMSGILFGSKVANTNVEKTSKNAEVYHAAAATAKSNQTKKLNETKTKVTQKISNVKNNAVATVKKAASTVKNAKSSGKTDTEKKTETKVADVKNTETKAVTEKTAPVINKTVKQENTVPVKDTKPAVNNEVKTYCNTPVGKHQFYQLNDKGEYRANIKFKYCMIKGEKKENLEVGIIVTDLNAVNDYIKKYSYLHLKDEEKLHKNADGDNYYYYGAWSWDNSLEYHDTANQEKNKK